MCLYGNFVGSGERHKLSSLMYERLLPQPISISQLKISQKVIQEKDFFTLRIQDKDIKSMSCLASLKCTDYGLQRRTLVITSVFLALRKRLQASLLGQVKSRFDTGASLLIPMFEYLFHRCGTERCKRYWSHNLCVFEKSLFSSIKCQRN